MSTYRFIPIEMKKFKMRLEKLMLDNNEQTDEAYKHIYTTLVVNKDIEISINIAPEKLRDYLDSCSDDDENGRSGKVSPKSVLPILTRQSSLLEMAEDKENDVTWELSP
jgi:hypothetical protein